MKKENGAITVITLVTMLFMLAFLLSTYTIITNRRQAQAELKEEMRKTYETEVDNVEEIYNDYVAKAQEIKNNSMAAVIAGERAKVTSRYTDSKGKTAIIPEGFTVSGVSGENTIENGLVVYVIPEGETVDWSNSADVEKAKEEYDQFVWIPIKNTSDNNATHTGDINDMYICQNKGTGDYGTGACQITVIDGQATCTAHGDCTQMAGRLYASNTSLDTFKIKFTETYTPNSGLREPSVTSTSYDGNVEYLDQMNNILGTKFANIEDFKGYLQDEYNKIVASVYTNGGYYVGRYETSNMSNSGTKDTTVRVVAGTTTGINNVTWYRMYGEQVNYAKNKELNDSIGSTMIQGTAYDQEVLFANTESYNIKQVGEIEHNFREPYNTGSQSTDLSKNIYDLEGNMRVWTTEHVYTDNRMARGGSFGWSASACSRDSLAPSNAPVYYGSQLMLYVK